MDYQKLASPVRKIGVSGSRLLVTSLAASTRNKVSSSPRNSHLKLSCFLDSSDLYAKNGVMATLVSPLEYDLTCTHYIWVGFQYNQESPPSATEAKRTVTNDMGHWRVSADYADHQYVPRRLQNLMCPLKLNFSNRSSLSQGWQSPACLGNYLLRMSWGVMLLLVEEGASCRYTQFSTYRMSSEVIPNYFGDCQVLQASVSGDLLVCHQGSSPRSHFLLMDILLGPHFHALLCNLWWSLILGPAVGHSVNMMLS